MQVSTDSKTVMPPVIEISDDDELENVAGLADVETRRIGKRKRTASQRLEESRLHAEKNKARMDTKKKVRSRC